MESVINKITTSKEIMSVKDGFLALTPLTIINSFLILLLNIPFIPIKHYFQNNFPLIFEEILPNTTNSFYSFISLFVVFVVGFSYSEKIHVNSVISALCCLFSYLVFIPFSFDSSNTFINSNYTDSNGVFLAIIIAIVIPKLIKYFDKYFSFVKFPESVPKDVSCSLAAIFPILLVTILVMILSGFFLYCKSNIFDVITSYINKPLLFLGANIFVISVINLAISLFWFFGFNGSYLFNSIMKPIYITLSVQNLLAINSGISPPNIITGTFQSNFVNIGGCGSSLALIFAIFLVSKSTNDRFIAKLAFIPSIFNINEPLVYGI